MIDPNLRNKPADETTPKVVELPKGSLDELSVPRVVAPGGVRESVAQATSASSQELQSDHGVSCAPNISMATSTNGQSTQSEPRSGSDFFSRSLATIKGLGTSIGSTLCYGLTGVFNQGARGQATDIAQYPNPFLYCGIRSGIAAVVTYFKDRKTLQEQGVKESIRGIGRDGRVMCMLMGANNVLWVPAFMLTDLASALVIGCSQPFVHAIYDRVRTGRRHSAVEIASLSLTAASLVSIACNTVTMSASYPHALWGNMTAAGAMLCFCSYAIINNRAIERAKSSAGADPAAQELAKRAAQEKLKMVPFFSQATSSLMGFALFIPLHTGTFLAGGLGLSAANTLTMAFLQGSFAAGGLYLRTLATQSTKPLVVSLISNAQVGLTPLLGYLILGSTIPQYAIVGGLLSFAASMVTVMGEYQRRKH